MNRVSSIFKSSCAIALIVMASGCATAHPDRDKIAISAGFKILTPTTPEQKALYAKLPEDSVTPVQYKGGLTT